MKYIMITLLSGLLVLVAASCKTASNASTTPFLFPVITNTAPTPKVPHDGFVILNNQDTLFGRISLDQDQKKQTGITIRDAWQRQQFINYRDLQMVRLFAADPEIIKTSYTDFRRLDEKPKLWRQIATGKMDIYDETLYVDEVAGELGAEIVVVDRGKAYYLWNFWHRDRKQDLLKFVNNRYGTNYRRRDYKTSLNLIELLVTKG